jgi:hypothetical protein
MPAIVLIHAEAWALWYMAVPPPLLIERDLFSARQRAVNEEKGGGRGNEGGGGGRRKRRTEEEQKEDSLFNSSSLKIVGNKYVVLCQKNKIVRFCFLLNPVVQTLGFSTAIIQENLPTCAPLCPDIVR